MRARYIAALSLIHVLIPALVSASNVSAIEAGPSLAQAESKLASYDTVNPYYTMQCSFSKYRMDDGAHSGFMGHTVIYIKGACRDKSAPYLKLKMCDPGTDLTNPNSGVGLSAEKVVSNSEYVATDGLDFLLNGSSRPDEPITQDTLNKTIEAVIASGSLNGLKIHDSFMKEKAANQTVAEYIAWQGLVTDFAVSFGRDSTCARIPMTRAQIQAEVNYLNDTNEPFVTGAQEFNWSAVGDNCAHFTHDVLAAAGIRNEIPRSNDPARVVYNFVSFHWEIPRNDVLIDMEFANDLSKIRTAEEVFSNHEERDEFNRLGTLPRLGATLNVLPMHLVDNSVYKSDSPATFLFDIPVIKDRERKLKSEEKSPTYEDLSDNLRRVLARLRKIQGQEKGVMFAQNELTDLDPSLAGPAMPAPTPSPSMSAVASPSPVVSPSPMPSPEASSPDWAEFKVRYDAWIDQSITIIQGKLAKMAELNLQ
jgi:hypothetical protein